MRDTADRHVESQGEAIHADAVRHHELLIEDFDRMRYGCGERPAAWVY